mmetsp:Transcript_39035/g.49845  ORF Transcript_39035/g.49845 Transcript_39035/m.49845 type:complete len:217 (+) Transcript_39035:452-1102(+)
MSLKDSFEDEYHIHLISPIYRGGQLFEEIVSRGRFKEIEVITLVKQMLQAIGHCHSNGIVHRDVKPENFLFREQGSFHLVLIDFGFSRSFSLEEELMKSRVGTIFYMAPEVLAKKYNEKCDIWALGVIMYVLLCGYFPFNGEDDSETMEAILSNQIQFPEEEWDCISPQAKELVQLLLKPNFKERLSAHNALLHPYFLKSRSNSQRSERSSSLNFQ